MKTYKFNFILFSISLFGFDMLAQPDTLQNALRSQKIEVMTARMEMELGLSATQKEQVQKLLLARFENIQNGYALDLANSKAYEKLTTILTTDQQALYFKLRADTKRQKSDFLLKNPTYNVSNEDKEMDF